MALQYIRHCTVMFNLIFAVSPSNQLWGINKEGQLFRRHLKYIIKDTGLDSDHVAPGRGSRVGSDVGDWELV